MLVGTIPADYGGRTASILTKCRILYEEAGVESLILTTTHSPYLPDAIEAMRRRGHLGEGVRVESLLRHFPDSTTTEDTDRHLLDDLEVDGLTELARADGKGYDYFDRRGVHRRRRTLDARSRLLVEDHYSDARARTERREFDPETGRVLRSTFWDNTSDQRRQDIFYRRNGHPLFTHATSPPERAGRYLKDDHVVFFDEVGRPVEGVRGSFAPVIHRCLDAVIGQRPTILSVEARYVDRAIFTYDRPHVRACYVLHSSHLRPPGEDTADLRWSYRPLLGRSRDVPAVVFLTESQRAAAEAELGHHDSFAVIPHTSPPPMLDPQIERDPDLVVMVGRLAREKRISHAIRAFASVVQKRPTARLEIYGTGPQEAALRKIVIDLGLQGSVLFKGFTDDPGAVYQRASLCLLTSTFEGAPLVLVEALRHGCPVISYDISYGPADIIDDGVNGFLVPAGDRAALASRITTVLSDPELSARLVAGCAEAEARFGPEAFVARWSDLFHRLVDSMEPLPDGSASSPKELHP